MADSYFTIAKEGTGIYKEKMSKFLSFSMPVANAEDAKQKIKDYKNEYNKARHVCWAYKIGPDGNEWQLNDDGEPSGTAGKPILGQINSFGVTDTLVIVVRYFGGIKLGTPGLIAAYREAARLALEDSGLLEQHKTCLLNFTFPYESLNGVMKVIKTYNPDVINQNFDNTCEMSLKVREDMIEEVKGKIFSIDGVTSKD